MEPDPDDRNATTPRQSGRRAEASRNDQRILEAAREVFVANPEAPISAVAERAGVGISALYRRYEGKDELLRTLCWDGLLHYTRQVEEALAALDAGGDPWEVFARYMDAAVAADASSLVQRLAGTFTPLEEMFGDADRANRLSNQLIERVRAEGAIRADLEPNDVGLLFEQLAAVRVGDRDRTLGLRRRYLALVLDGIRASSDRSLPGTAPTWEELNQRWVP